MIKLEISKMTKAIERARGLRPRVRVISAADRTYSVTGSKGGAYIVRFAVVNGLKLAECDCKAGKAGVVCYHIAAAAQVNVMTQSMRRASAPAPAPAPVRRRDAAVLIKRDGNAVILNGWTV